MDDDEFVQDLPGNAKKLKRKLKQSIRDEYSESSDEAEDDLENDNVEKDEKDDDSDMFASDEEDNNEVETEANKVGKSKIKKLDMDQFEKDVGIDHLESDTHNINDHKQRYVDDTNDNVNSKEPKLESFDLRKEEQEGYFDEDGNFIRNNADDEDDDDDEDWLQNINHRQIELAQKAEEKRQEKILEKSKIEKSISEVLKTLIDILEPDETPMEALSRFAPKRSKKRKKILDQDLNRKQMVNQITEACDVLMLQYDVSEVYQLVREELMRLYTKETGDDYRGVKRKLEEDEPEIKEQQGDKIWEFKWEGSDEVFGPYTEYEMACWKEDYFENKVFVKRIDESEFVHVNQVIFTPMNHDEPE